MTIRLIFDLFSFCFSIQSNWWIVFILFIFQMLTLDENDIVPEHLYAGLSGDIWFRVIPKEIQDDTGDVSYLEFLQIFSQIFVV